MFPCIPPLMHDEDPLLHRARITEPDNTFHILRAKKVKANTVFIIRDQLLQTFAQIIDFAWFKIAFEYAVLHARAEAFRPESYGKRGVDYSGIETKSC